ncbi:MAG: radical SAM protein [Lachnospiraceae bacterium]|nr:radical SAM protein [Lachnospiraceae bacterium]MBQ7781084.1 radical SAM protein [Lachnospiraceae bacterium]
MGCRLCPRECNADRAKGEIGYCGESNDLRVARAALHMWEEPCISGETGSGTVFFTGCPLKCIFCQNNTIANGSVGKSISSERLAEIFLELQKKGACNINLVTATHFIPQIIPALKLAKTDGLSIPVVYNCGGYEKVETLRLLDGLVDIYLPDLKYYSPKLSTRYSNAPDYFEKASAAISEMVRQTGTPIFDEATGLMKRGVIVRHLLLPKRLADSKKIMSYLYNTYKNDIYVSIMSQYTPMGTFPDMPELNRRVSHKEYNALVDYCLELGIENGFIQEGEVASESFIPPFDLEGV